MPQALRNPDARLRRVIEFFEGLEPRQLEALDRLYDENARFIDPFNDVVGVEAVRRVFAHMFETLEQPRFRILAAGVDGDDALLLWAFTFQRRGRPRLFRIEGTSHLVFASDGRIDFHRDHWDPQPVYELVPGLRAVLRWLRRRLAAR
jgi:steroid Delta-isomerase